MKARIYNLKPYHFVPGLKLLVKNTPIKYFVFCTRQEQIKEAPAGILALPDSYCVDQCTGALDSNLQRPHSQEEEIERHKKGDQRIDIRLKTLYLDKCDGLFDEMEYVRIRQS